MFLPAVLLTLFPSAPPCSLPMDHTLSQVLLSWSGAVILPYVVQLVILRLKVHQPHEFGQLLHSWYEGTD